MSRPSSPRVLLTVLWASALAACASSGDASKGGADSPASSAAPAWEPEPDPEVESVSGAAPDIGWWFDEARVLEVSLELDPSDWQALRFQTRSMFDVLAGDCMAAPVESPFTWFEAELTVDGEVYEAVSVRKKGFIGSLSTEKPGLKLEFDELVDDRRIHGLERVLLNNTPQDPTMLRTCLAYDYFARAGVAAPRCGFAHVVVNGEDMGIYATVQPVDDHFFADHLGQDAVPVFEGTLSDFREGWTGTFDPDSPEADPALIEPLRHAVESGDLAEIEAVFDVDAFVRFWVAEAITGHWDGYGWNTNNYFVYIDPTDGLARFVPWGPDAAWSSWSPGGGLDWLPLNGLLARTLAELPEGQARYRAELQRQLDEVWSVGDQLDRVSSAADHIARWHRSGGAVSDLQTIIDHHDRTMARGLDTAFPAITWPPRDPFCMSERGTISFEFEGAWGSIDGSAVPGTCTGSYTWDGGTAALTDGTFYTGVQDQVGIVACVHATDPSTGAQLLPHISLPPGELVAGEVYTDFTVRRAALYYADAGTGGDWVDVAWMEGTLQLSAADAGGTVRGAYTGTLWSPPW